MPATERLTKPDLLLHPVRMRILITLAGQRLTAQQLIERLDDVSQATLYRQLGVLAQHGVITVVETRPVRGTVEKIYAVASREANLTSADLAAMTPEDHLRSFTIFLGSLLDGFQRYVSSENPDFVKDGFGYRALALNLDDEEFKTVAEGINAAVLPFVQNGLTADRRQRLLATIVIPDTVSNTDEKEHENE